MGCTSLRQPSWRHQCVASLSIQRWLILLLFPKLWRIPTWRRHMSYLEYFGTNLCWVFRHCRLVRPTSMNLLHSRIQQMWEIFRSDIECKRPACKITIDGLYTWGKEKALSVWPACALLIPVHSICMLNAPSEHGHRISPKPYEISNMHAWLFVSSYSSRSVIGSIDSPESWHFFSPSHVQALHENVILSFVANGDQSCHWQTRQAWHQYRT